jgi:hypothetical protein
MQDLIIEFSPEECIDTISLYKKILEQESDSESETLSDIELQVAISDTDKFEFIDPAYRKDPLAKSNYLLVNSPKLISEVIDDLLYNEFSLN